MADDDQWIHAGRSSVDISSAESILAKLGLPRVLVDAVEVDTEAFIAGEPVYSSRKPFRIDDNETLVYTDRAGREYMIEITALMITEDEDAQRRERRAREARRLVRNPPPDDAGKERVRNFYRSRLLDQEG